MVGVRFRNADGTIRDVDAREGFTLMETAKRNGIAGIEAECGGACSCATCHVIIDPEWIGAVGPAGEEERDLLQFARNSGPRSRLSCQIRLDSRLEGLSVEVPVG